MIKLSLPDNEPELMLLSDIKHLIESAREAVISKANAELVILNWNIGKLIKSQILKNERSDYGEKIVATLSQLLSMELEEDLLNQLYSG